MSWTLGRASFTNDPSSVSHDGDRLTIAFNILPSTLAEAKVMRQQVLGVADNVDEPVIPVTMANDADYDGFYRVRSAQVEPVSNYRTSRLMRAQVSLERVAGGYYDPLIETPVISTVATNAQSITTPTYAIIAAFPPNSYFQRDLTDFSSPSSTTLDDVNGDTFTIFYKSGGAVSGTARTYGDPATHYDYPNCVIEVKIGATWYPVVGRQLPGGTITDWRIHNGFIKLEDDLEGTLSLAIADSSAWTTEPYDFDVGRFSGTTFNENGATSVGPFILRNSPETVVVRTAVTDDTYTFTLVRGGSIVSVHLESNTSDLYGIGLIGGSQQASTAVTGGVRTTATDSEGNRAVMLLREDERVSTTTGAVGLNTQGTSASFSIGINLGATTGIAGEAGQLDQLCSVPNWRQQVVAR